jgi:acetyltransferase-like isoleucine patch superfamily enzyme
MMEKNREVSQGMDTQKQLFDVRESKLRKYKRLVIGEASSLELVKYELIVLLSTWVPGALGLFLRSKLYPRILKHCGRNVIFGMNVVLRHPGKIAIGDNVVIDDNIVLDAKGVDNQGIVIGNNVYIGRNSTIYCQNGDINIGDNGNISSNCQIFSAKNVTIGEDLLMGAYSYLVGGGHVYDDIETPIIKQGRIANGIVLKNNIWVGAAVKILDGVTIGQGAIIGTGAVVNTDVPEYNIVGGVPAKFIRDRRDKKTS